MDWNTTTFQVAGEVILLELPIETNYKNLLVLPKKKMVKFTS